MRHRARRFERRVAGAVTAGGIAGAVAGNAVSGSKQKSHTQSRSNTTFSMGQKAGNAVGAVLDTKNKVKDKANAVRENIKDVPTQTAYAVHSAKEKAKSSVSDFKRGVVQEQTDRQAGRYEKQQQHRQNIADKRMELQKAQEAKSGRKTDGSATAGATCPHERPATSSASEARKQSAGKPQEVKRPATSSKTDDVKMVKERPLASGKSVESTTKVNRQNLHTERITKTQQTTVQKNQQTTEKNRKLITKKGQKKK